MQTLTSLSSDGTTCSELQGRLDASLVQTSPAEPLNATSLGNQGLSSVHIGEGRSNLDRGAAIGRIPVISADGTPLMPCKPAKARKLLKDGKAIKKWSKLGVFYIQLIFNPRSSATQPIAIGIDPGSKFEGLSVVGTRDTVLNMMAEAVDWVKKALKQRREMRRIRRYRKTRRRELRGDNRLSRRDRVPPSTKARWDAKLRVIRQLRKIIPVQTAVVEDIKAETRKGQGAWNSSFSPLEVGKRYFYSELEEMGLEIITRRGIETQAMREQFRLKKLNGKSKPVFETHCVDSWVLAASLSGAHQPTTKSLYYLVPLRWYRRQLNRLEPEKGGIRRRYGGTISLGLKKGTLVKHIRYGLCYIGGHLGNRFSLHSYKTGERLTQQAKREEFAVLTRVTWRTRFLP